MKVNPIHELRTQNWRNTIYLVNLILEPRLFASSNIPLKAGYLLHPICTLIALLWIWFSSSPTTPWIKCERPSPAIHVAADRRTATAWTARGRPSCPGPPCSAFDGDRVKRERGAAAPAQIWRWWGCKREREREREINWGSRGSGGSEVAGAVRTAAWCHLPPCPSLPPPAAVPQPAAELRR
jgi:hypothetical protein